MQKTEMNDGQAPGSNGRRAALSLLARADKQELAAVWKALSPAPSFETVRPPETGLVMVRGRIGGGGAPFNFGEVTVTRCAIRMESGEVGFGHVLGRDRKRAELVACFDALLQSKRYRGFVEERLRAPVAARAKAEDDQKRRQTAATRVNFFTMVRGDDE